MTTDTGLAKAALAKSLRTKGYIPASEVAQKLGMHINSVYRWINEGEVVSMKLGNKRFIKLGSLVGKIGKEAALAVGLIAQPTTEEVEVET